MNEGGGIVRHLSDRREGNVDADRLLNPVWLANREVKHECCAHRVSNIRDFWLTSRCLDVFDDFDHIVFCLLNEREIKKLFLIFDGVKT